MALLLAVFCFWHAGRQSDDLLLLRSGYKLDAGQPLENAPPLMAFTTVALGGFSGLMADFLWLRASHLQDEDRYFELVQLSDWITKLQPRSPAVWEFHAWNLSYNISVMMADPEDRWRWVSSGIALLRDDGLRYNPGDGGLCNELAWIYQFKIGGNTDLMHRHYKKKLAAEIETLMPGGALDYEKVVSAPAVARKLRGEYKMKPEVMREIDARYGPFDWRVAEAHAIYWAYVGKERAKGQDRVNAERITYQCMAGMFERGRLVFRSGDDVPLSTPNVALLSNAMKAYESAIQRFEDPNMKEAYRIFLNEAVAILLRLNRTEAAEEVFAALRQRYPAECPGDLDSLVKSKSYIEIARRIYVEFDDGVAAQKPAAASESWMLMGTQMTLTTAGGDSERIMEYRRECRKLGQELEDRLSVFKQDSEVGIVNQAAGWAPVSVSAGTLEVLTRSLQYSEISGGAFDITVAPLVKFWGFNRGTVPGKVPEPEDIAKLRKLVGWKHLVLSNDTAFLDVPDMSLDLGGIAKGYAVDVCYRRLVEIGAENFIIDLGGNMRCAGSKADQPWRIGVRNPFDKKDIIGTLSLSNGMAVATSGNYEKFIMIGDERFTHIIDPRTGYPVKGMAGVTVVTTNAVEADAMSTALFVLGTEAAKPVLAKAPGCEALFVSDQKPMVIKLTGGMSGTFAPEAGLAGSIKPLE